MTKADYLKLCEAIWEHNRRYYVDNAPTISDYEFDRLLAELFAMEKSHPEWVYPGSPTQRVGEAIVGGFKVVAHRKPMLSLANTYSADEIREFMARIEKLLGQKNVLYTAEIKIDGVAIAVRFEEGLMVQALTRGNGDEGEDITHNVATIKSLPLQCKKGAPRFMEARGEVFLTKKTFAELNEGRAQRQQPLFANPRNAAAGSLKLLDPKEVSKRKLDMLFHGISESDPAGAKSHYEALDFLKGLGLAVIEHRVRATSFEEIWDFASKIEKRRSEFAFEIDGIVIKVDDLASQERLGVTGKNYRWAVAYKFMAEKVSTVLREITVQVGRSGVLTPVAELEPVFLMGSTISRATLHNEDEVHRKDIRVGDTVYIEKGGDVIPKVAGVNLELRPPHTRVWEMPESCPVCRTKVVRLSGEVAVRCPNKGGCAAQNLGRIVYFASKAGLDIEHLGVKVAAQLQEKGFVQRVSDIFRLTAKELSQLKNFKEKSIKNLLDSIEESKDVQLHRFIMALGIKYVGEKVAEMVAAKAQTIEKLMEMNEKELIAIEGVGEKVAGSIVTYFSDPENRDEVKRLQALGVKPRLKRQKVVRGHVFTGKTFVLTGKLEFFTRDQAAALIKKYGGKVASSVSGSTHFLLAGSDPGSKLERATELKITILTEKDFMKMLSE